MSIKRTASEAKQKKLIAKYLGSKQRTSQRKKKWKKSKSDSIKSLKKLPYSNFLETNYWKKVRELVLKRDGYRCVICHGDLCLQVHHDTYKNHGDELNHLEDLMTLCRKCHIEHHLAQ